MNFFSKKPTLKEQQRENDRDLRKASRDIERERRELEKEEQKLVLEIKKYAREGNKDLCKTLAKQLISIRKQKTRNYTMNSKIQGVGSQNRVLGANVKLTEAMSTTAKTMKNINEILKPEKVAGDMRAFQQASAKIDMTDEMISDSLDDILNESGDEEESEGIVKQVLDEIGIEISGKVASAPSAIRGTVGESTKSQLPSEEELEMKLSNLRA